jgi:trk system potassium uptake protein TrkA
MESVSMASVVSTKDITASKIISYIRSVSNKRGSNVITLHKLVNNKVEASEFFVSKPTKYTSKCLKDLNIKKNILLAGIIRGNKVIIPGGLDTIEPLDSVIIVSSDNVVKDVIDILE